MSTPIDTPKESSKTQRKNEEILKHCDDERLSKKAGYGKATNAKKG